MFLFEETAGSASSTVLKANHIAMVHPLAGTLSLDTAGPYQISKNGRDVAKYILVGTYTWLLPKDAPLPPETLPELDEDEEQLQVELDDEEDEVGAEAAEGHEDEEVAQEDDKQEDEEEPQEDDQEAEEREDPRLVTYRMAIPLPVKDQKEILSAIQQMYIQLRIHGYHVVRLHTELGGEFRSRSLKQWCRSRDIQLTTTAGVSSQANGRAERAIQTIKGHVRRLVGMAGMDSSMWAYACRYVHEREQGHEGPATVRTRIVGEEKILENEGVGGNP